MPQHIDWSARALALRMRAEEFMRGFVTHAMRRQAELESLWKQFGLRERRTLIGVGALVVVVTVVVSRLDWSGRLSPAEIQALGDWARGTGSAEVWNAYAHEAADGRITVRQADEIVEQGKGAASPKGQLEPVGPL